MTQPRDYLKFESSTFSNCSNGKSIMAKFWPSARVAHSSWIDRLKLHTPACDHVHLENEEIDSCREGEGALMSGMLMLTPSVHATGHCDWTGGNIEYWWFYDWLLPVLPDWIGFLRRLVGLIAAAGIWLHLTRTDQFWPKSTEFDQNQQILVKFCPPPQIWDQIINDPKHLLFPPGRPTPPMPYIGAERAAPHMKHTRHFK